MKRLIALTAVGGLLLNSQQVLWASSPGTTAAEVLKIGVGARAIGMGEAYVAQADDVSSLYWNPAGLALMQERQASFTYDQMYQDLKYQNASVGIPLENGAIGGSLSYLNYGDIQGFDQTERFHRQVKALTAAWPLWAELGSVISGRPVRKLKVSRKNWPMRRQTERLLIWA